VTLKVKYDLKERSYEFSLSLIKLVDALANDISTSIIARQLLRAGTSIGANIAEAQASPSRKDFAIFLRHSLKSANESIYWLRLLKDAQKSSKDKLEPLIDEATQLSKILGSSLLTIRDNN